MPKGERNFGFISEFADRFPKSWLLVRVTAEDPITRRPCYGKLVAQDISDGEVFKSVNTANRKRARTQELPIYITHAFWHRTRVSEAEIEDMADGWMRSTYVS